MSEVVPVSLGHSDRLEDLVGKLTFATGINPTADLAYRLLHSGYIKTFHVDYIEHPDGKVELIGVCMDTNKQPEAPSDVVKLLQEYFKLKQEEQTLKNERALVSAEKGQCETAAEGEFCYQANNLAFADYCDVCKVKHPITKKIHANAHRRVAILNSLRAKVNNAKV